jgi:hypothetical protein
MQRKYYSGIGLLAGLLAIAMMTLISTSADARSGATSGSSTVSQGSSVSNAAAANNALVTNPGKFHSRVSFNSAKGFFNGLFVPTTFVEQDGKLLAKGAVSGKLKRNGHAVRWISQSTTMVVKRASVDSTSSSRTAASLVSCNVLHLVLGPLDLNLLGLVVHLDRVVLDITAVPAGGLLGQLLCSVANLLNGGLGGLLGQLADLLNQILGQLGL